MRRIKILITGAGGQLGKCIVDQIEYCNSHSKLPHGIKDITYFAAGHNMLDITDKFAVSKILASEKFDYLINCAAYTDVAKAEDREDIPILYNGYGPKTLAECCTAAGVKLIHFSSDYIFDGSAAIKTEETSPGPLNRYGRTKLLGDTEIINTAKTANLEYMIFRTSWVYSEYGKNFVKTIFYKLLNGETPAVVYDQVGSPTYAGDLARFIINCVIIPGKFISGLYNYSNLGVISWYDFAKEIEYILKSFGLSAASLGTVTPQETDITSWKVNRPLAGILSKKKIISVYGESEDVIRHWKTPLKHVIEKLIREQDDKQI